MASGPLAAGHNLRCLVGQGTILVIPGRCKRKRPMQYDDAATRIAGGQGHFLRPRKLSSGRYDS
jgi:hypothetical protein